MHRRRLLTGAGGLLLLAAAPGSARATSTQVAAPAAVRTGAARASRITHGTRLVHADLHNHSLMSDGSGDPELAFASMRAGGLDVAALTDHATLFDVNGLSGAEWRRTGELADAANRPGVYTALRGFEWSHSALGHVNVWYTGDYTDLNESPSVGKLYDWLTGTAGIGSFNHPGRQPMRFDEFAYDRRLAEQMVGLEMFNNHDDYLFDGWPEHSSPLTACLNAGWRTGLTGVTDEHGADWGFDEGRGRTGLWVTENTRNGVLAAMRRRRFFATRVTGLRLDALADGVRMGGSLPIAKGDVRFRLDLDRGPEWAGRLLCVQVLRPGTRAPEVVEVLDVAVGRVTEFTVPLDVEDGPWVVLRVSDPAEGNPAPGPDGHPCNDYGLAYTSPWWLAGDNSSSPARRGR